jgi:hypothetical protein
LKSVWYAPETFGDVATLQLTPFQVRIRLEIDGPVEVHVPPTAVHAVALKQLTPTRKFPTAGGVAGAVAGNCVQAEPFHVRITFSITGPELGNS